ncbi:glutaredoxin family protein [Aliidiomarina soli]|uniref:Glutaredoxin n=1 Tax=Aliidiomarina soli TaxID=1928574 RepID=A0A432WH74_9GAMM|nr:glutathione S-transferase N-terminal domain-containing protein [Aliidiomarina soli]RUO33150.1 glutaredoxin [Aliidiomarina soli]
MKVVVRYFFRGVRAVLTPVMLISETLTTPKPMQRSAQGQQEVDKACRDLALYQFRACPFCIKVRKEMRRLNLPIEIRDAQLDPKHRETLLQGGGKSKVPCLLIRHQDREEWLYESDDIKTYLNDRFAAIE